MPVAKLTLSGIAAHEILSVIATRGNKANEVTGKTQITSVLLWNANQKQETYRPILEKQTKIDQLLLLGKFRY